MLLKWDYNLKNIEGNLPLGVEVTLVVPHSFGKLPEAMRPQRILLTLGAKKSAILF